ncbi:hypothetical protein HY745_14130 [Candidatus Desantisbacteria bacterium]|nr:hypothetical protein [Candidatus Desantisbacteria bacterium]
MDEDQDVLRNTFYAINKLNIKPKQLNEKIKYLLGNRSMGMIRLAIAEIGELEIKDDWAIDAIKKWWLHLGIENTVYEALWKLSQ